MSQGTVSVAANGTVTKSGMAGDIYDARVASLASVDPPGVVGSGPSSYAIKHGMALDANAISAGVYPSITSSLAATVPPGTIVMYGGSSAPSGWLLCDASAVSRTTYADLFAVISTTFGVGDGSTTFNVPDLRGRVPLGVGTGDAADATAHTLAQKAGTETHTLTTTEMPSHTHGPGAGTSFITKHTGAGGYVATGAGTDWDDAGTTTASVGSGGAHNNMPPYLGLNFIIKV